MIIEEEVEFLAVTNSQVQEITGYINWGSLSFPLESVVGLVKKLMIDIREFHQEATKFKRRVKVWKVLNMKCI